MTHELFTGRIFESEMVGEVKGKKEFGHERYLSYRQAMNEVVRRQPDDPQEPTKHRFAADLHAIIAEMVSPEDYSRLYFFTAVGSVLDYYHGIDGFFIFDDPKNRRHVATFDITTNPNKENKKADIIIFVPEMKNTEYDYGGNPEYKQWIDDCAKQFTETLSPKNSYLGEN